MFEAWGLPAALEPPEEGPEVLSTEGLRVCAPGATAGWMRHVAGTLRRGRAALMERPAAEVVSILGRAGARFLDADDPLRIRALELLPPTSGLSARMSSAVLDGMAFDWTEDRLTELLYRELADPAVLDGFVATPRGKVRAIGPELCVQVLSGSVPGVGATALVRSLLVKSPTLLKPGRGDLVLPILMARALREVDAPLADAVAVIYWPGGSRELEEVVLGEADAVVVYGGDEVVRDLRDRTPSTTRFVAYHHRVSVGVVGRDALDPGRTRRTATEVAGAVALFDQRGCVSPQVIYVEEGGGMDPRAFALELAAALDAVERSLPGGTLDASEASALHQLRGTAELMQASGSGVELVHGGRATWTVVFDPEGATPSACVGRTVRVSPVRDAPDVAARIAPLAAHLQTVGVSGCAGRREELAEAMGRIGVSRVAPFGAVPFPPPWWHHDGRGPLEALLRWVDLEE